MIICNITVAVIVGFSPQTNTDGAIYAATDEQCPAQVEPAHVFPGALELNYPSHPENGPTGEACKADPDQKGCENG